MANIKKSFNFRNGVQVDDDNLKVSATGLVGIGTTVPTEALDVRGNLVVSGVSSAVTAQAGVMTVTTLNPTEIIGAGVSIVSGIVTASSGIITFFGDARFLQGMPTSQWEDTNTGLGVSSIYNTGGTVGIATTNPVFTLQVGNDPNSGQSGVGIGSFGDIKVSGVITATSFSGNLDGDITGNISGGTVISGVSTFSDLVDMNSDLDVDGHTNLDNVSVAGVTTFAGIIEGIPGENKIPALYANLAALPNAGDYHGMFAHVHATGKGYYAHAGNWIELVNKDTSGDVPITGDVNVTGGITATGTISGQQISGTVSVNTASLNATNGTFASTGFLSAQGGLAAKNLRLAYGVAGITDSQIMSVSTPLVLGPSPSGQDLNLKGPTLIDGTNPKLNVLGNITINNTSGKVGVGTISPVGDIQVRRYTGNAEIQVTAETGASRVSLGVEPGTGQTNHTELRYNLTGQNQFDGTESFSIVNFGKGNFNYMMSAADANAATGNFFWMKGNGLSGTLMTLTPTGRLGIGLTTPTTPLHVLGAATISGSLSVGNNLTVSGSLNSDVSGNVTGNLTGNVNGNANAAAGISTFNNLLVAGISTFTSAKINTTLGIGLNASEPFSVNSNINNRVFVSASGNVGIKTTNTDGNTLLVAGSIVGQIIGAGTTIPLSTVDFSLAGQGLTGSFANKMFMIPPKVGAAQTAALAGLVSGAMIYNTNLNKLQVYNGTNWETITSVEVTG